MSTMQKGIPLNDMVLGNMQPEERAFWNTFMQEAMEELERRQITGASQPFAPSDSLRNKFQTALTQYDGEKYCQIQQLAQIFDFTSVTS